MVFLWPLMMWREGLYPGFEWFGGDHLQRIAIGTTLASIVMMAATFVTKTGPQYSRPLVVGFWLITLLALPLSRLVLRRIFHRLGLSGPPAVLLGGGGARLLSSSRGFMAKGPRHSVPSQFLMTIPRNKEPRSLKFQSKAILKVLRSGRRNMGCKWQ